MTIYGAKYPYAFIHIPKTGGSSVTAWLCDLEGWNRPPGEPHAWQVRFHQGRRMHQAPKALEDMTKKEKQRWHFAFMRDPLERYASWYRASGATNSPGIWLAKSLDASGKRPWLAYPQHRYTPPWVTVFDATPEGYQEFRDTFRGKFADDAGELPWLNKSKGDKDIWLDEDKERILSHDHVAAARFGY